MTWISWNEKCRCIPGSKVLFILRRLPCLYLVLLESLLNITLAWPSCKKVPTMLHLGTRYSTCLHPIALSYSWVHMPKLHSSTQFCQNWAYGMFSHPGWHGHHPMLLLPPHLSQAFMDLQPWWPPCAYLLFAIASMCDLIHKHQNNCKDPEVCSSLTVCWELWHRYYFLIASLRW